MGIQAPQGSNSSSDPQHQEGGVREGKKKLGENKKPSRPLRDGGKMSGD